MPARSAMRAVVYGLFYRLPHPLRVKLVRLLVPKYIVGAVVFVRDTEATAPGRLLLLRQPPGRGWSLPAGLLRKREEPAVGGLRELAEETGIELPPEALTPAVPNAIVHAKGWVDTVFEAWVPASTTRLKVDGAEVWEAAWHRLDALPRLTDPTARLLGYYGMGPLAAPDAARPADPTGPDADQAPGSAGPDADQAPGSAGPDADQAPGSAGPAEPRR